MTRAYLVALAGALAAWPAAAQDARHKNEIEISEASLNELIGWLGDPSDGGVYTPTVDAGEGPQECELFGYLDCPPSPSPSASRPVPGPASVPAARRIGIAQCRTPRGWLTLPTPGPVTWRWWVTGARLEAQPGSLRFSAKVEQKVGTRWTSQEKSVEATLVFDAASHGLRLSIDTFKVPLVYDLEGEAQRILEVDVAHLFGVSVGIPPQSLRVPRPGRPAKTVTASVKGVRPRYEDGRVFVALTLDIR